MKMLTSIYNLPARGPKGITKPSILAEYVFEKCFHLIPNEIKEFFNVGGKTNSILKSELIMHMIINAYMVHLADTEGNIKRNGSLFTKVNKFFEISNTDEKKPVSDLFGSKDLPRVANEHFNKLGIHWILPPLSNSSHAIPAFASPLIAFQAVHVDSHKVMKSYTDSQHSRNFLKQHKDKGAKLHLHFYDNFKYLLDQFPTIDKIERLFENNRLVYHPTLNRILFEREYQIGLASKIAIITYQFPDEVKNQYYRILSTIAMLPNVNGRLYYLTAIILGIPLTSRSNGSQVLQSLTIDEHLIRINKLSTSLIGMGLITIPVMEAYFLYLCNKGNFPFENMNMKTVMENYGQMSFIDDRVEPVNVLRYGVKMPGARLEGEWELVDLPFARIRDIIINLNRALDIQRDSLSNIYLTPHQYLKENGLDKYDLLSLNEDQVVRAVSEVIKEKYFPYISNSR
ncbi:hypothetical protein [Paenibacillus baekrokdamisoli]|nr:hypothetical protein [Paenibacillus baekrokdamisoli]